MAAKRLSGIHFHRKCRSRIEYFQAANNFFPGMRFRLVRFPLFPALSEFPDAIRDVHLEVLWCLIYMFLGFHHIFRGQSPNVDVLGATVRPDNAE